MKGLKSLLLGAAAGLAVVSSASAADLGAKKPSPVEYVRACYNPLWGTTGGFIIPGTQTCLRISGQARFDLGYGEPFNRGANYLGYRGGAFIAADAITPTEFGNLRAFAQVGMVYRTGQQSTGTGARQGTFTPGTFGNGLNVAGGTEFNFSGFIQFAGFTVGRTASFFNPVGTPPEVIGSTFYSSPGNVTTLAYTANLGNGFLATIAIEDPTVRQQPIINGLAGIAAWTIDAPGSFLTPSVAPGNLGTFNTATRVVPRHGIRMPNIIGALRLDQAWGSASLSGAIGEVATAGQIGFGAVSTAIPGTPFGGVRNPNTQLGFAIAAGVKINLPMIAAGDALYLTAAYSDGMSSFSTSNFFGGSAEGQGIGGAGWSIGDAVFDPANGRIKKTRIWSITGGFQHFWTPQLSSTIFGSYAHVDQPRTVAEALVIGQIAAGAFGAIPAANAAAFASTIQARSGHFWSVGLNTIWQPVRGLNIAGEVSYVQADPSGRVYDINRNRISPATGFAGNAIGAAFCNVNTQACRTVSSDGAISARLRITRDF
jgi:hypothetical protein